MWLLTEAFLEQGENVYMHMEVRERRNDGYFNSVPMRYSKIVVLEFTVVSGPPHISTGIPCTNYNDSTEAHTHTQYRGP